VLSEHCFGIFTFLTKNTNEGQSGFYTRNVQCSVSTALDFAFACLLREEQFNSFVGIRLVGKVGQFLTSNGKVGCGESSSHG
jgi:hypothetical protein